jgi:uncharacterized heparinase superfamily protein
MTVKENQSFRKIYCSTKMIPKSIYWPIWVAKKIASRDPFYLFRHFSYIMRKKFVDSTFYFHKYNEANFQSNIPTHPIELLAYYRQRQTPIFHFQFSDIEKIASQVPVEQKETTIKIAEEIVHRRFAFRGQDPILLQFMDWQFTPRNDLAWTWDLNRHFYFSHLGFAYWYTQNPRYAQAFFELISSWIEANAKRLGKIEGDTPFEVAARLNAWIWAYFLFLHCPLWDTTSHYQFIQTLGRLSEYLYQTIEFNAPGNHILLEAKALVLCAELFPEFQRAQSWACKGWRILKREVQSQIADDGVHCERSTMYHQIIAGELAELMLFCNRNNINKIDNLFDVVRKMADFLIWIDAGNGSLPLFGDAYIADSYFRFSAPAILAALCEDTQKSLSDLNYGDQTHWVLGANLKMAGLNCRVFTDDLDKPFSSGGYYISRSHWGPRASVLVWDCGPVGYKANTYHSHLDVLSFTLTVKGVPIFIDPGTSERSSELRHYLRGTAAHNTVLVDGENQSILARRNEIWGPARAKKLFWGTAPDCAVMVGSHNGYKRLSNPVLHIRTIIIMSGSYWLLHDRIEGRGSHKAEQRFHLTPGASLDWVDSEKHMAVRKEDVELLICPVYFSEDGSGIISPQIVIEPGVAELEYGRLQGIDVINCTRSNLAPFSMAAFIIPSITQAGRISTRVLNVGNHNKLQAISIQTPDFKDEIYFRHVRKITYRFAEHWETDSRVVVLRYKNDSHKPTDIFLADASFLNYNSLTVFENCARIQLCKININGSNI